MTQGFYPPPSMVARANRQIGRYIALAFLVFSAPATADSTPSPESCSAIAKDYADQNAAPADVNDAAVAGGMDGAVLGGFGGRRPGPDGWSARGAERGARALGALAVLNSMQPDPEDWRAKYQSAYDSCMAGPPPRVLRTPDAPAAPGAPRSTNSINSCRSSAIVSNGNGDDILSANSRRCR